MVKVIAADIIWDTDNEEEKALLPERMVIPREVYGSTYDSETASVSARCEAEEKISDYITEETGFCHDGFKIYIKRAKESDDSKNTENSEVSVSNHSFVRLHYEPSKDDPDRGECLWADFDFYPKEWTLKVSSDCGSFSCEWNPSEKKAFLSFCAGIKESYLLSKLCRKDTVDIERTRGIVEEYLNDMGLSKNEIEDLMESYDSEVGEYMDEESPKLCRYLVCEWNEDNDIQIDEPWELVFTDWSYGQKKIGDIFIKKIQPTLRKLSTDGTEKEEAVTYREKASDASLLFDVKSELTDPTGDVAYAAVFHYKGCDYGLAVRNDELFEVYDHIFGFDKREEE